MNITEKRSAHIKKWIINFSSFNDEFEYDRLWIHVAKVNPVTNETDDDETKNKKVEIWLECFLDNEDGRFHDIDLDCGGDTFEDAIIKMASLVKKKYGDVK